MDLELKAEKVALDNKILLQEKKDKIEELQMELRHMETAFKQAKSQIGRANEDVFMKIQEALDKQSDRLSHEK